MQTIDTLIQTNRQVLIERWSNNDCLADLMFKEAKNQSVYFIDRSYKRLESIAKMLLQFLRRTHDRQALGRMLPSIRAYRQGKRNADQLRQILAREIEGVLLEDAVKLGVERGFFVDLGHSINLTPDQDFETLYPNI